MKKGCKNCKYYVLQKKKIRCGFLWLKRKSFSQAMCNLTSQPCYAARYGDYVHGVLIPGVCGHDASHFKEVIK